MTLRYIIAPGTTNEVILTEEDIISHNPRRVHTGIGKLRATIIENRDLDSNAQRQDRLNVEVDGNVQWTGYIVGLNHTIGEGRSRLTAHGIAKRLQETRPDYDSLGGSVTYSNTALEDALDDYWSRTPFNASVTPQSTESVATDTVLQSADTTTELNNILSFADTEPATVSSGVLKPLQSCFTIEGENFDRETGSGYTGSNEPDQSDFSNGDSEPLVESGASLEYDFTVDYTIPADDIDIALRYATDTDTGGIAFTATLIYPDGTEESIDWRNIDGVNQSLGWRFADGSGPDGTWSPSKDLEPGTATLRLDSDNSNSTSLDQEATFFDVVAPYDKRFSYTFDNTVDSNGYLSGPETKPDAVTVDFAEAAASFNITEAGLNLTINDTSNNQALSLSFDGGSTYTTASNTSTLTTQPSSPTRKAKARVTLSRFGSRTTATPTTGFNGQEVEVEEIRVDLNDLVVVDGLELSRNHFENLQQLHEYGGNWNWTIEHDSSDVSNMTVLSYQQGDETRSKPSSFADPISENAEVQAEAYFNSIYLQGSLDSSGDRPTAEEKDSTRISNDGREISPGVLRDPKISTESGALFKAASLLETALSNNELVGTKTLPSDTLIDPGYQYPVDFGNGDVNKTLEEVSLTESPGNVNIRARFSTPRSDLSAQIRDLKRGARDRGDNI